MLYPHFYKAVGRIFFCFTNCKIQCFFLNALDFCLALHVWQNVSYYWFSHQLFQDTFFLHKIQHVLLNERWYKNNQYIFCLRTMYNTYNPPPETTLHTQTRTHIRAHTHTTHTTYKNSLLKYIAVYRKWWRKRIDRFKSIE